MTLLYLFAALSVAVSAAAAALRNRKNERGRLAAKLSSSLLFCLTALAAA